MLNRGYKEFASDIKEIFDTIVGKYKFIIVEENEEQVILESNNCVITISILDYWEVGLFLSNIRSNLKYDIWKVNTILKKSLNNLPDLSLSEKEIFNNDKNYREFIKARIKRGFQLISINLTDVLEGDFSWVDKYKIRYIK